MASYADGPWRLSGKYTIHGAPDKYGRTLIVRVRANQKYRYPLGEDEANARLMSISPQLADCLADAVAGNGACMYKAGGQDACGQCWKCKGFALLESVGKDVIPNR